MGVSFEDLGSAARRAARNGITTSVGLGLLAFQRAQVQRRELIRVSSEVLETVGIALENRLKLLEERLAEIDESGGARDNNESEH